MANLIFYAGPTGQTLYVRIKNPAGNYVATALTEGSTGADGTYTAAESTIAALTGMSSASTGNGCAYTVRTGSASTSAEDSIVASGFLPWSGSAELSATAQILAATNGSDTVGNQLQNLDSPVSEAGAITAGGPVLQRTPAASRVLQVRDRGDGTYGVVGSGIRAIAGEPKQLWALEFKGTQLGPGQLLYGMTAPELQGTDLAHATVGSVAGTDYGACLTQARFDFSLTSSATEEDDITVKVRVTFSAAADGIDVYVPVSVKEAGS